MMETFNQNIIQSVKFAFNGKFLGDYTQYLTIEPPKKDESVVTDVKVMRGKKIVDFKIAIEKYSSFELIISELMDEFDLPATNYGVIEIKGKKYLMRHFIL